MLLIGTKVYRSSSSTFKLTNCAKTSLFELGPSLVVGQYILSAFDKKLVQNEKVPWQATILLGDYASFEEFATAMNVKSAVRVNLPTWTSSNVTAGLKKQRQGKKN
jgi:hypothetical protein